MTTLLSKSGPGGDRKAGSSALPGPASPIARFGLLGIFVLLIVFFSIINPDRFPTTGNASTIALGQAANALLAFAVMVPLAAGQFDLSVGYQFGFAQSLLAWLAISQGIESALALLITLVCVCCIGLANGLMVTRLKLPSFTTTIGTGIVVLGITEWLTGNQVIFGELPGWFANIGRGQVVGIPLPFVIVIVVAVVLLLLTERTLWGRRAYATGANPEAARLTGIPVDRLTLQSFLLGSVLCTLAGAISMTNLGGSSPVVGLGALLPAFAGAFLGATGIRPGRYNVLGTLIAIYLVGTGISGLQQLGVEPYVQDLFNGVALLAAIVVSAAATRRFARRT
ncbi:ABC transporter permease [Nocardioides sp.]|uniref:ABC transporter permease n=1 Tax=Nocardioides sp. TaxID=35761 RepID=UPI0039E3F595